MKADKALLFEPSNLATRRLVETVVAHIRMQQREAGVSGGGGSPLSSLDTPTSSHIMNNVVNGSRPPMWAPEDNNGGSSRVNGVARGNTPGLLTSSQSQLPAGFDVASVSHTEYMSRFYSKTDNQQTGLRIPPFELEVLEAALIGATGGWLGWGGCVY